MGGDLPRTAAHPFYARLNQILEQHDFDAFVEALCRRFYADEGRPWMLQPLAATDPVKAKTVGIDSMTLEANAALRPLET